MNIRTELENTVGVQPRIQLNDVDLNPAHIRAILINEVVPADPHQDFYGSREADYLTTTFALFREAGLPRHHDPGFIGCRYLHHQRRKDPQNRINGRKRAIDVSLPYLKKDYSLFPQRGRS